MFDTVHFPMMNEKETDGIAVLQPLTVISYHPKTFISLKKPLGLQVMQEDKHSGAKIMQLNVGYFGQNLLPDVIQSLPPEPIQTY